MLIHFKGYFQGQNGPIWTFVIYLGQYIRKSYIISQFTLWPLPLDDLNRSKQGHIIFNWLYLINGSSYEQSLCEIHIISHISFGHSVTNISMKDIYEVIYDLSVYLMTIDLGWYLRVKLKPQNFQSLVFYDQSLYEIQIYYVIYGYSFFLVTCHLVNNNWKGKSRSLSFKRGIFHKPTMLWLKFIRNTYRKLYMTFQFNLGPLTLDGF